MVLPISSRIGPASTGKVTKEVEDVFSGIVLDREMVSKPNAF